MLFQVTAVEFDFDDDYDETEEVDDVDYKQQAIDAVLGEVFEVEDEEELADVISDQVGWCIKNLIYRRVYA
jgi:hypothetical protein